MSTFGFIFEDAQATATQDKQLLDTAQNIVGAAPPETLRVGRDRRARNIPNPAFQQYQQQLNAQLDALRLDPTGTAAANPTVPTAAATAPAAPSPVTTPAPQAPQSSLLSLDIPQPIVTFNDAAGNTYVDNQLTTNADGLTPEQAAIQSNNDRFLRNQSLQTGAQILGGVSGAVQAYTGLQQLDLARESFRFNRSLARANLANQTKLANLEIGERNLARSGKGQSSITNREAVDRVGLVSRV